MDDLYVDFQVVSLKVILLYSSLMLDQHYGFFFLEENKDVLYNFRV